MTRAREGFKGGAASRVVVAGPGGQILVYSPAPGPNNLVAAISSAPGTDAYGNTFQRGLSVANTDTGPNAEIGFDVNTTHGASINASTHQINFFGPGTADIAQLILTDNGTALLVPGVGGGQDQLFLGSAAAKDIILRSSVGLKAFAGIVGRYHNEENTFSVSATSLVSVLPTAVSNVELDSDYGTGFSGGTFSAPVAGIYSSLFTCNDLTDNVARSSVAILRNGTIIARNPFAANAGFGANQALSVSATRFKLALSDTLTFQIFNGAATKTVTGTIWVGRHT